MASHLPPPSPPTPRMTKPFQRKTIVKEKISHFSRSQAILSRADLMAIEKGDKITRMVVKGQLVEPAVCFSDLKACEELIRSFIRQKP